MPLKIGRNDPCPCGCGKKYKHCCLGKIDWSEVPRRGYSWMIRHLSTRGKNLHFLKRLCEALQIDRFATGDLAEFKKAFTAQAVRQIYEAVAEIWPDNDDLTRVLTSEATQTSGLYVGHYHPEIIERAVTRHTIYSDTLLLIDPFTHPKCIREKYNPLVHPEHYRPTALRCALLWFHLAEWIDAGVVRFIQTPGHLDPSIALDSINIQNARFQAHPELDLMADEWVKREMDDCCELKEAFMLLSRSNDELSRELRDRSEHKPQQEEDDYISFIQERRERNPCYIEPIPDSKGNLAQIHIASSGASYDMAKRIAKLTKSHLITDLPTRWKEMEIDRAEGLVDENPWSPFAKAFHGLQFSYLSNVPLDLALKLRREEDRLGEMRSFMRKIWRVAAPEDSFCDINVENLADELREKVREAEDEWSKIDRDLLKWIGITTAGSFVAFGGAQWVSAALGSAVGGVGSLVIAGHQRHSFERRYPAAFLLKLKERKSKIRE